MLFPGSASNLAAATAAPEDSQVVLAFLYNFTLFVEWPDGAFSGKDDPIIIGIIGDDPFGEDLHSLKGRTVNGRKVLVNRFKDIQDIRVCHILFVSDSERDRVSAIVAAFRKSKMLLVSRIPDFARRGGTINFVSAGNKIGLEVNLEAAKREGLMINSRLLNMSKIISGI